MKLINKKTGQIGNFILNEDRFVCTDLALVPVYYSLAELNEDWEDYEEPEKLGWLKWHEDYWYIKDDGAAIDDYWHRSNDEATRRRFAIGNIFGTDIDAMEAVEKLKAWKRLRDAGFKFYTKWTSSKPDGYYYLVDLHAKIDPCPKDTEFMKDLDLLFENEFVEPAKEPAEKLDYPPLFEDSEDDDNGGDV